MLQSFTHMEQHILKGREKKRVALAGAHDLDALRSLVDARRKGIVEAILIGREEKIRALLAELGEDASPYLIIPQEEDALCARTACQLVRDGQADIPMKGIIQTAAFMRAILDKGNGFVPERGLLSQATLLELPEEERMMIISDCAVNIAPEYPDKVKILQNAVFLAHRLGIDCPKAAVVAPVEVINPVMQSTIDAAMLSKANERGQIRGCIVDGPLGLDNAVSLQAAKHKGISSPVAGVADILLMPDLCAGNIFTKSLTYFAKLPTAGALLGASIPVIMTSRTDSPEDKYHSILTAVILSQASC